MNIVDKILMEAEIPDERMPDLKQFVDSLDRLVNEYESKGVDLDIRLRQFHSVEVNMIKVPSELKNKGLGSGFMDDLSELADKYSITLTLSPSDSFGSNLNRLKKFYKRFGFRMNTGRKADHRFSNSMIREPK